VTPDMGVKTRLLAITALTALVNGRIWTLNFPPSPTLPGVLVQAWELPTKPQLRGTVGHKAARIQLDVLAESLAAAEAVDAAIMGDVSGGPAMGLEGFAGSVSGSFTILSAFSTGFHLMRGTDELSKQRRVIREFRVTYED
jgi:hypothetical protein